MLKFTQDSFVDIDTYEQRINGKNFVYMDRERIQSILKYELGRRDTMAALAKRTMRANSSLEYSDLSSDVVYSYLVAVEGMNPSRFKANTDKGYTLDSKKVLKPMLESGLCEEFLMYYMAFNSLKTKCGRMEKVLKGMQVPSAKAHDGTNLFKIHFSVNQQENLRYNYKNQDLISLPKEYSSAFRAEDGYVLAWGDFAQSDFRIAYNLLIRDDENYEIMRQYKDSYAGMAAIIADSRNEKFDLAKFEKERDAYKVNILATIYGQRHGNTPEAQKFINKFSAYLATCPRYMEYFSRIENRIDLGLAIPVSGYFGYDQHVQIYRNRRETIDKCLNTPVQTGTSEIVILCANAILEKFYSLGYTEEDVCIHHVRHDEPIFKLKKEVLKDAWVFNEASTIIVDNWTPLNLDFEVGYDYGIADESLMEELERSYKDNLHRLTIVEPSAPAREYWPIPKTYEMNVGIQEVGDETIVAFYNRECNGVQYLKVKTTDSTEVFNVIKSTCINLERKLYDKGYTGIIVNNTLADEKYMETATYYSFCRSSNGIGMNLASLLAHWTAYKYAVREKINFVPALEALNSNKETLYGVGALDVFEK